MIYVVYLATLIPHTKVRDNSPLFPTIIFNIPTYMQVKVTIDPVVLEMDIEGETMEECEQEAIDTVLQHWEVEVVGDDPNEDCMHKTFTDDEVIEAIQGGLEIAKEKGK